jgi:hypothetical protein
MKARPSERASRHGLAAVAAFVLILIATAGFRCADDPDSASRDFGPPDASAADAAPG